MIALGGAAPALLGVLNVTPDSFSDGGSYGDVEAAVTRGLAMLAEGAAAIDVGGESTRPGAEPVPAEVERARVVPVIAALRARTSAPIAIDTMKPEVARAAVAAGATIWNDVSALRYAPASLEVAAELGVDVILMHMQGEPRTMQADPAYTDVAAEVAEFLEDRAHAAESAGVAPSRIWVDPGIGFGKTLAHNLALIRGIPELRARVGRPLVFGASRKSFIAKLAGAAEPSERLGGSIAAALLAADGGADLLRVHDVAATAQALAVWRAVAHG